MSDRRNALAVRESIEAAHPEIAITTPITSRSGQWELSVDGSNTLFDDFWMLVDHLAAKFDDVIEPEASAPRKPTDRWVEIQVKPNR